MDTAAHVNMRFPPTNFMRIPQTHFIGTRHTSGNSRPKIDHYQNFLVTIITTVRLAHNDAFDAV